MKKLYKRNFWCWIGLHKWYTDSFASPVWGRTERHCLQCDKRQCRTYNPLGWMTFKLPKS